SGGPAPASYRHPWRASTIPRRHRPSRIRLARTSTRPAELARPRSTSGGTSRPHRTLMPLVVVAVAIAAALGVGLVVYGIVATNRDVTAAGGPSPRATYRTLADVREQLRRRFEPTGAPVWIAQGTPNALAAELASGDLKLRAYEFRMLEIGDAGL